MYAIKRKEIDGFDIITGFVRRPIDPVATQNAARVMIQGTTIEGDGNDGCAEWKALMDKKSEQSAVFDAVIMAKRKAGEALKKAEEQKEISTKSDDPVVIATAEAQYRSWMTEFANQDKIYKAKQARLVEIESELKPISADFNEHVRQTHRDNPIYFEPNAPDEIIMDEAETEELRVKFAALLSNKKLCTDGSEVFDHVGQTYHFQIDGVWGKRTIVTLGEFPGETEILESDLTSDQREEIRMQGMTDEQKAAEYDSVVAGIKSQAVTLRSQLELEGLPASDALEEAQTWMNDKIAEAAVKYGIS